jgi:hypothetical protein
LPVAIRRVLHINQFCRFSHEHFPFVWSDLLCSIAASLKPVRIFESIHD